MTDVELNGLAQRCGDTAVQDFATHLRERAAEFFPDLAGQPVQVRLISKRQRVTSTLFGFVLAGESTSRRVLVKVGVGRVHLRRRRNGQCDPRAELPWFNVKLDPDIKGQLEYAALARIHDHFHALGDERFGTVRPLDYLPEQRAVIMEEVHEPIFQKLFLKSNRLRHPLLLQSLQPAFRNAGAWLREYHGIPAAPDTPVHRASRAEVLERLNGCVEFLASSDSSDRFFANVQTRLAEIASRTLADAAPLAVGHGDYGPRNILIGPSCRVTVFDTLSRCQVPIYDDLSRFLCALKTSESQLYTQGRLFSALKIAECEREFLSGYFGSDPVPLDAIRLFEAKHVLEMWATMVYSQSESSGVRWLAKRFRLGLRNRYFRRYLEDLLGAMEQRSARAGPQAEATGATITGKRAESRACVATSDGMVAHLRDRAAKYFPEFAGQPVEARLLANDVRRASTVYRYALEAGNTRRTVRVKISAAHGDGRDSVREAQSSPEPRPRLAPIADSRVKFRLEHAALCTIHRHFQNLGDPRFGTVRPLDLLPEHGAIVMEEVTGPSLRQLVMRESRLRQPFGAINLHAAMRHAGAWLRVYDGIPATGAEHVAHASRADFIDSVNKLAQFLGCALDDSPFFGRIAAETIARLRRALPDELPLGVRHGDYTLRNILVGPGDRVTAIDTLANCRTPIYHDIAYFLMSLKTMRPQVYTQGLAFSTEHLRRYEQAFLAGYFGSDPLPVATIRLFEVQAVLDKWASTVELFGGPRTPIRRIWDPRKWRVEFRLRSRFLRRHVTRLLREMNESC